MRVGLINLYTTKDGAGVLYELLSEREPEARVSHEKMPTWQEHLEFITTRPFRFWYLIAVPTIDVETHGVGGFRYVGALEVTDMNEVGISILKKYQNLGYGTAAWEAFVQNHQPLPAIRARRNGRWLANVATDNTQSKLFFRKLGFKTIQETLRYDGTSAGTGSPS